MILPDLAARIAWYQGVMRPDDPAMGAGVADWTISAEYRPDLVVDGVAAWGCMCSPGALPEIKPLTAADIAARTAHIIVRTPSRAEDLPEIERTILHEMGHVLVAPMQSKDQSAEENAMHSLDALFAKLSPELGRVLARAMQNPKARAYSAREEEPMADDTKGPEGDKKPPEGDVKKQEGGPRDVAAIQEDIVKAVLANQPTDELAKELVAAQALAGAAGASAPAPAAPEPPAQMGMSQDQAYARAVKEAKEARTEAIESMIDERPDLGEPQRVMLRKQSTVADARALLKTYPRPASAPERPTMGLRGHPSTEAGGGAALTVRARAMQADPAVMARIRRGTSDEDTLGLHLDEPGHILAFSPTELLKEQFGAFKRAQKGAAA